MSLPNDLSKDTKAIIASNLTVALSVLVASGKKEEDAKPIIIGGLRLLFDQIPDQPPNNFLFRKDLP
jgi:hypothetical protein